MTLLDDIDTLRQYHIKITRKYAIYATHPSQALETARRYFERDRNLTLTIEQMETNKHPYFDVSIKEYQHGKTIKKKEN